MGWGFLGDVVDTVSDTVSKGAGAVWDAASDSVPDVDDVVEGAKAVAEVVAAPVTAGVEAAEAASDEMSKVGDTLETVGNAASPYVGLIPGVGEAINAAQVSYQAGAMLYDMETGDRDGAVSHGVQGLVGGVGMVPGFSEGMGLADMVLGPAGAFEKEAGIKGADDMPQSVGDIAAGWAVTETNKWFGEDDTNWLAPGDRPSGTRRGEIGAGLDSVLQVADPIGVNRLVSLPWLNSAERQDMLGDTVGDFFDTPRNAPTLGAGKKSSDQREGLREHKAMMGLFDGLFD